MTALWVSVAWAAIVGGLLFAHDRTARRHEDREVRFIALIADLCQRIQAPDVAVAQHLPDDDSDRPLYLSEEDQDRIALQTIQGGADGAQ